MIRYALLAGGILAKQPEEILLLLQRLAEHLGLAFQIRDDLLDVIGTTKTLGKTAGKMNVWKKYLPAFIRPRKDT